MTQQPDIVEKAPGTAGQNLACSKSCVFIISAPSGSGKSTLVERLLKDLRGLRFSVSYTTRKPRGNEQNGREYYFVSRPEFEAMIGQDDLLEWAEVFGNYYGTARRFFDEARQHGEDLLLDIDVQGAAKVRKRLPEAISIFILPPSRAEMEARLRKRDQDSEEVIAKRLSDAQREIKNVGQYDYVLINDQLERSAEYLCAIVMSERNRVRGGDADATAQGCADLAAKCKTEAQTERVVPIVEGFNLGPLAERDQI
jgi:guanylate kinase